MTSFTQKTTLLASAAALTAALSAPAVAGTIEAPAPDPVVPTAAPVYTAPSGEWTGAYVGGTLGYGWGADVADGADDATYGVFGGYNYDFGNFVLGGELEYLESDLATGGASVDDMTRLKLRAGYDLGKALVYGVVGANYANATIGGTDYSDTGVTYGLGMDYAVTDQWTAGFEVLQNDFSEFDNSGSDLSAVTVGARASFRF
ncbi:outer membrane protein [Celeribacter sp.]|uniref:outer membrane protein n=1 Tax=Celeribacter sp. TaxID=1890673 RepID=UPI003A939C66